MKDANLLNRGAGRYESKILQFLKNHKRGLIKTAGGSAIISSVVLFGCDNLPRYTQYLRGGFKEENPILGAFSVVNPTIKYGFAFDTFTVAEAKVVTTDVFQRLLSEKGQVSPKIADDLTKNAKSYYDFDKMQNNCLYTVLSRQESADYFVFEPDPKRYILFDLKEQTVKEVKRTVEVVEKEVFGTVKNSLWETMVKNGMTYQLADKVEDALKYKFDLRKFEDGDTYKLIYDDEVCEGRSVGIKTLKAVCIQEKSENKPVFAFYYEGAGEKGYFSKDGLPMKEGFLKSPLKYTRITSRYNLHRFHPVLHYRRPHFGTDYAASYGTPILSVADGVVEEARYKSGNGNYVKLKHQKPYETQYLHMSRFANGIKPGAKVNQGQVIGYVGSTGLSTGPHVCFRFWKNGQQVDHLREKLPKSSTFSPADVIKFKSLADHLMARLEQITATTHEENIAKPKALAGLITKP
jgi:murein DD-endopeptidase MepM/ murein hydrolase activator NlpD